MIRKLLLVGAAVALPLGLVTTVGLATAGAKTPPVVANGTVNCTGISGKISFNPAITLVGPYTNSETATLKVKLGSCTPTSTNLPAGSIITGSTGASITTTGSDANSCTGLETSHPVTLTVKWKDKNSGGVVLAKLAPSTVAFSGYDVLTPSNAGFDLPQDSGGTATGTAGGSFFSTDNGASSQANAFTEDTITQITDACETSTGVAKLKLGGPGTGTDPSESFTG